jgi:transposase
LRLAFDRSSFAYRYLPPCSPDLNPIELARAEVELRHIAARTADAALR